MDEANLTPSDDPQALSFGEVLRVLAQGEIEDDHGLLPWGSNYAYLITVREMPPADEAEAPPDADDPLALLAVYKPQRGERPLWDFPEGTLCKREVATFLVSEQLGWEIVPPTVLRGGPYGLGSVQFFVDHDPEINYFTPFPEASQLQLMRIAAFDYLVNNADRKGGHCLLDARGHLWGIDHGLCFHPMPKLRTVIWDYAGQQLADPLLQDMEGLCEVLSLRESPFRCALLDLLNEREVGTLQMRVERLLKSRRYPQPGAGPNYPWPPV